MMAGTAPQLGPALLVLGVLTSGALSACDFPEYMQTNQTHRDWRYRIKSQYRDFTVTVTVHGNVMKSTSNDGSFYNQVCLQGKPGDKFVVSYEEEGRRSFQYMCVQFIKRSENVIQLNTSEISNSMRTACDGDLSLDPWLMIDKAHVLQDSQVCPLVGGFSVQLYDREMYSGVCDAYSDNSWIESECKRGNGLYFNYRYGRCIPNVLMSTTQRTICVTSWTEDRYIFLLIRHNTSPFMWVVRYPSNNQNSFVAYLMREIYASIDPYLSETDQYIRMTTVPNIARPVTSLCIDESEACSYGSPCTSGDSLALTCPRTCGLCNVTRPSMCSFQSVWQGDWIDATHGDRVAVTFNSDTLTVYYSRTSERFYCVRWDEPYSGPAEKFTTYGMLVSEFDNGCRPAYSCVKVVHSEQSPVMFLRLSIERHWPFTSRASDAVNCHTFSFDGDDKNTLIPNRYRSKHYKLLYSKSLDTGKMCNIPIQEIHNYTVTVSDDTQCLAGITNGNTLMTFSLNISLCTKTSTVASIPTEHYCVESLRFFSSEQFIVTRTGHEPFKVYCWVFPKKLRDVFYLVEAAHCNENTKKRIIKGHLKPLAAFHRNYGFTTTVETPTSSGPFLPPLNNQSPSGENSVMDTTTNSVNDSSQKTTNTTGPGTDPAAYASPVVVMAAIIFFVIFQIPCMCKNS